MNIDKAIAELRVELANLDTAIAVLDEHLGCASGRRKPSSAATRREIVLVQGKRGDAARQRLDPDCLRARLPTAPSSQILKRFTTPQYQQLRIAIVIGRGEKNISKISDDCIRFQEQYGAAAERLHTQRESWPVTKLVNMVIPSIAPGMIARAQ